MGDEINLVSEQWPGSKTSGHPDLPSTPTRSQCCVACVCLRVRVQVPAEDKRRLNFSELLFFYPTLESTPAESQKSQVLVRTLQELSV